VNSLGGEARGRPSRCNSKNLKTPASLKSEIIATRIIAAAKFGELRVAADSLILLQLGGVNLQAYCVDQKETAAADCDRLSSCYSCEA
jgi:hypothetical protein